MIHKKPLLLVVGLLVSTLLPAQKTVVERAAWVDNRVAEATSAVDQIDIADLKPGMHALTLRVKDSEELWSAPVTRYFVVPSGIAKGTAITQTEYWIDQEPASRATFTTTTEQLSLVSLAPGMHALSVRCQADNGLWSAPVTRFFIVPSAEQQTAATIERYLYWFDDDPTTLVCGTLDAESGTCLVDIASLSAGDHTLTWRVGDSKGAWSPAETEQFTVVATGIDGINVGESADSKAATAFTLDGKQIVLSPAGAMEGVLTKGIYILNGRKVVVK